MFPPQQLGFPTSKAVGEELKGQVVTFWRVREKGGGVGGGWVGQGQRPRRKGGSRAGGVAFFFSAFALLSLHIFSLNQNQAQLPGERDTDSESPKAL